MEPIDTQTMMQCAMCNVRQQHRPESIAVQQVVEEAHKDVNRHRYNVGQDDSIAETGRR